MLKLQQRLRLLLTEVVFTETMAVSRVVDLIGSTRYQLNPKKGVWLEESPVFKNEPGTIKDVMLRFMKPLDDNDIKSIGSLIKRKLGFVVKGHKNSNILRVVWYTATKI